MPPEPAHDSAQAQRGRIPERVPGAASADAPGPSRSGASRSPISSAPASPDARAPGVREPGPSIAARRPPAPRCSSSCAPTGSAGCAPSSPKRLPRPSSRCCARKPSAGASSPRSAGRLSNAPTSRSRPSRARCNPTGCTRGHRPAPAATSSPFRRSSRGGDALHRDAAGAPRHAPQERRWWHFWR